MDKSDIDAWLDYIFEAPGDNSAADLNRQTANMMGQYGAQNFAPSMYTAPTTQLQQRWNAAQPQTRTPTWTPGATGTRGGGHGGSAAGGSSPGGGRHAPRPTGRTAPRPTGRNSTAGRDPVVSHGDEDFTRERMAGAAPGTDQTNGDPSNALRLAGGAAGAAAGYAGGRYLQGRGGNAPVNVDFPKTGTDTPTPRGTPRPVNVDFPKTGTDTPPPRGTPRPVNVDFPTGPRPGGAAPPGGPRNIPIGAGPPGGPVSAPTAAPSSPGRLGPGSVPSAGGPGGPAMPGQSNANRAANILSGNPGRGSPTTTTQGPTPTPPVRDSGSSALGREIGNTKLSDVGDVGRRGLPQYQIGQKNVMPQPGTAPAQAGQANAGRAAKLLQPAAAAGEEGGSVLGNVLRGAGNAIGRGASAIGRGASAVGLGDAGSALGTAAKFGSKRIPVVGTVASMVTPSGDSNAGELQPGWRNTLKAPTQAQADAATRAAQGRNGPTPVDNRASAALSAGYKSGDTLPAGWDKPSTPAPSAPAPASPQPTAPAPQQASAAPQPSSAPSSPQTVTDSKDWRLLWSDYNMLFETDLKTRWR